MWIFTDIADWWDSKNQQTKQILDQWVEESGYSQGAIIVASAVQAFTTFGAGATDLLRLGDGVKQGTWGGAGHDALRAVAVFPVGKAVNLVKSASNFRAAKLIIDINTEAGICSWVASAKALRQTGHRMANGKLFATVQDLAQAAGVPLASIGPIHLSHMRMHLLRIGANVGPIQRIATWKQAAHMIPHDGSVVLISVRAAMKTGPEKAHAIYAYRRAGQIRIMDRTVSKTQGVYKTLDELVKSYREVGVVKFIQFEAAVLRNVYVKSVGFELPVLAIPVLGVIGESE